MKVCEEMGLDRDTYSVTIPLGATINMDGAAITITVMTMATAFTLGINVDIPTAIILMFTCCSVCMWSFRCCRWIPSADSAGMFSVWYFR